MENIKPEDNRKIDERNEILAIYGELAAMGNNDYELPEIERILVLLEKGKCTPEDALKQVHEIRDRKNQDH